MVLVPPYPTINFLPFDATEDLGCFAQAGVDIHGLPVRQTKQRTVSSASRAQKESGVDLI